MVKSILIALTLGALALLPQDASATERGRSFKHGHQHGQVTRFHGPAMVFQFGQPHKRWQHRPAYRHFGPPGHRAWLNNPARRHYFAPPRHRGWAHGPARFNPRHHKPRHHGRGWRW